MPNRILKDSICTSETLDGLSPGAEIFFYRLLVQADDYGRMDARPAVLRARCFPLRLEQVQEKHVKKWLTELVEAELIVPYTVNGSSYLLFTTWSRHQQIRNLRARFPAPPADLAAPREHPLPVERDVEDLICACVSTIKSLDGGAVQSLERQQRIGESYLDVVVKTETKTLVLEIKRVRLSNKAIEQVTKYTGLIAGGAAGVLIGAGLTADFDLDRCRTLDVAVITYDEGMGFSVISPSTLVISGEILGLPVKSQAALNPNPNPDSESESESDSTSAAAGAAGEGEPKPGRREILKELEVHFSKLSKLELPARETDAQKREGQSRWWLPLWEIYELSGDVSKTKDLLGEALAEMDRRKLTVAAPQSVQKVAVAIAARRSRGGPAEGMTKTQSVIVDDMRKRGLNGNRS